MDSKIHNTLRTIILRGGWGSNLFYLNPKHTHFGTQYLVHIRMLGMLNKLLSMLSNSLSTLMYINDNDLLGVLCTLFKHKVCTVPPFS